MRISIIIPVLNEAHGITSALSRLQPLRNKGHEIIVCDGGSHDNTVALATPLADQLIQSKPGRAQQMNAGANKANSKVLLFLHADTRLPKEAMQLIHQGINNNKASWGHFKIKLSGKHPLLRVVETLMNWRSRLSGIATGDQCIFVHRDTFEKIGGYPNLPLMEDIALCKQLKKLTRPHCIQTPAITSSRRWERNGILHTIFLMWRLRTAYFLGIDPQRLAHVYYPNSSKSV